MIKTHSQTDYKFLKEQWRNAMEAKKLRYQQRQRRARKLKRLRKRFGG